MSSTFSFTSIRIFLWILLITVTKLNAQEVISNEVRSALESIASVASSSGDKTTQLLMEAGFIVPEHIRPQWNAFPSIRKIETAYLSAAEISVQNGDRFLALLSQNLAQQYESVNYTPVLEDLVKLPVGNRVKYSPFKVYNNIPRLEPHISEAIVAISKYSDGNSFGVHRILKKNFGLPDDLVYHILRKSPSDYDALARGIRLARVPPSREQRLKNIVNEMSRYYEAARYEKAFKRLKSYPVRHTVKKSPTRIRSGTAETVRRNYSRFKSAHYVGAGTNSFKKMRLNVRGFGGVIFGNEYEVDFRQKLASVRWVHDVSNDRLGRLEFLFSDGSVGEMSPVSYDDMCIAYKMIFTKDAESLFQEGEGVGLAGIYDPVDNVYENDDSTISQTRFKVVEHPALFNTSLGISAIVCDALPIIRNGLKTSLEENFTEDELFHFYKWFLEDFPGTWKITEAPLTIFEKNGELSVRRTDCPDNSDCDNAYLMMTGFYPGIDSAVNESLGFYYSLPNIINTFPEYHHLNSFAKIFTTLRWIKSSNVDFPKPSQPVMITQFLPFLIIDNAVGTLTIANENDLSSFWSKFRGTLNSPSYSDQFGVTVSDNNGFLYILGKLSELRNDQWRLVEQNLNLENVCKINREITEMLGAYSLESVGVNVLTNNRSLAEVEDSLGYTISNDRLNEASQIPILIQESDDLKLILGDRDSCAEIEEVDWTAIGVTAFLILAAAGLVYFIVTIKKS